MDIAGLNSCHLGILQVLDVFEKEGRPVEHFLDLNLIKQRVFELAKAGDVVLLKGSKVNQMWQILE